MVRIGRAAGAPAILLVTETLHMDRVVQCAQTVRWERLHVENVDALHLSEDFETLQTSGLLDVGRYCTRLCTFRHQVGIGVDFCCFPAMLETAEDRGVDHAAGKVTNYMPSSFLSMLRPEDTLVELLECFASPVASC